MLEEFYHCRNRGFMLYGKMTEDNTVDAAKKDPFCPVLTLTSGVTMVFLHAIFNSKYVYPIEN